MCFHKKTFSKWKVLVQKHFSTNTAESMVQTIALLMSGWQLTMQTGFVFFLHPLRLHHLSFLLKTTNNSSLVYVQLKGLRSRAQICADWPTLGISCKLQLLQDNLHLTTTNTQKMQHLWDICPRNLLKSTWCDCFFLQWVSFKIFIQACLLMKFMVSNKLNCIIKVAIFHIYREIILF